MHAATERLLIALQRVEVHRVDVVLVRVDEHATRNGKLTLLVVNQQKTVVPAIRARLIHGRRDVPGLRVEIAHVQERRVVFVATSQQRLELDHDFAVGRDQRRRAGAVHALGVDDGRDELLPARVGVQNEERLIGGFGCQPLADVVQLRFVAARLGHSPEVGLAQLLVLLPVVSPAREVAEHVSDHIHQNRLKRIEGQGRRHGHHHGAVRRDHGVVSTKAHARQFRASPPPRSVGQIEGVDVHIFAADVDAGSFRIERGT